MVSNELGRLKVLGLSMVKMGLIVVVGMVLIPSNKSLECFRNFLILRFSWAITGLQVDPWVLLNPHKAEPKSFELDEF